MFKLKPFALVLVSLCFLSFSAWAQSSVYTVNVNVDVTDVDAAKAREKAMRSAYRQAFETIVRKLTSAQDAAKLSQMTDDQIVNFVKEVSVVSEKSSNVRYLADLQVTLNEPILNAYLQEKDIQTAVADKSKVVVIPVFRAFESDRPLLWDSANMWLRTWQQRPLSAGLIEIIPIPDTPISRAEIDAEKALTYDVAALREVALNNNANDVYVADAVFDGIEGLKVTLTSLKSDKAAEVIRVPGDRNMSEFLLAHGADEVVKQIENKIKNVNLAQSRVQSSIAAIFNFQKLSDWVKAEKQLKSIPYVKKVQVDAMGNGKVQLKIDFVGTDERIWSALRNKGFNLKQFDDFYLLEY